MLKVSVPSGKYGEVLQRCIEDIIENMRAEILAHKEGDRMYPEDVKECTVWVDNLWDQIIKLRNAASFSLSNASELGNEYELPQEDPLMVVMKNALLLEFVDQEIGSDSRSSISKVLGYIMFNPNFPDSGTRVYH